MSRVSRNKRSELEAFWRFHHDEWQRGMLNQREYCALHGLPLKRFGNWRAQFKVEEMLPKDGLLYRRGGLGHMSSHMSGRDIGAMSPGYIPSARSAPEARRGFSHADKRRIVAQTELPGASLSAVARRYGIGARLLFRWKRELAPKPEPLLLPVTVADAPEAAPMTEVRPVAGALPIIVERPTHGIEIELVGGRRVRFSGDADPATVRAMVAALEGGPS